jgi:hypothetical protein
VATLNRVRKGVMTADDVRYLNAHCATAPRKPPPAGGAPSGIACVGGGSSSTAAGSGGGGGIGGGSGSTGGGSSSSGGGSAHGVEWARPMLLAPVNAVVNERNARELDDVMARNTRLGRRVHQWIACDWVRFESEPTPTASHTSPMPILIPYSPSL